MPSLHRGEIKCRAEPTYMSFPLSGRPLLQLLKNSYSPHTSKTNFYVTDDVRVTRAIVESKIDKVLPLWTSQEKTVSNSYYHCVVTKVEVHGFL